MHPVDWEKVFYPGTPLLEILVRGTVVYLSLIVLLRLILKRQSSTMSVTDLLVVVLIADAAQNAMADDYRSLPDGILLVAIILSWSFAIDWLGFHCKVIQRLLVPPPLPLIEDGRLNWRHMRQELVTKEELLVQLREQGVDGIHKVKLACMESDGRISVVARDGQEPEGNHPAPEKRVV